MLVIQYQLQRLLQLENRRGAIFQFSYFIYTYSYMTSEINGFAVVDSVRASVVEEPPDKNENVMKVNDE